MVERLVAMIETAQRRSGGAEQEGAHQRGWRLGFVLKAAAADSANAVFEAAERRGNAQQAARRFLRSKLLASRCCFKLLSFK